MKILKSKNKLSQSQEKLRKKELSTEQLNVNFKTAYLDYL
jgi:hypothetical protein